MWVENEVVKGDQRKQREHQPWFVNFPNRQGIIQTGSEDNWSFHLPRSSPVISCHQVKKMLLIAVNKVCYEHKDESLHRKKEQVPSWVGHSPVLKMLQSDFPKEQPIPTSSASHVLLSETHYASAAVKYEKCFDKLRNLSLEKKAVTCSNNCLISGANGEEQISEAFYRNSMDLDQENAHFVVVDMVLEVLETAKWDVSQTSDSFSSTDSGYEELCQNKQRSLHTSVGSRCSAELLAQSLIMELDRWWISSDELLEEFPLVTVSMASGDRTSLSNEIRQKSRMRGTLIWTPPQFQIITSVIPTQRRGEVIASQQFLCAGCGTKIEPRYIKRLRFCDYLGKYFCDGCHSGGEAIIPARVLSHWDLSLYSVCNFSKQLLEFIWEKPMFKITDVAKNLYSQAKELQKFREIQEQLIYVKKLLGVCRHSKGVLSKFQLLPSHLTDELHLFSMVDFIKIKRGQYFITAKIVMLSSTSHIESCELCQAKGFICEFCHGKDVLFPFQTDICTRCQECRACFHTPCFRDEACPKCTRLRLRRKCESRSCENKK